MDNEVYVVLAYDPEGYIITGICTTIDKITNDMLDNGILETKVVKIELNKVIETDLIELDNIL